MWFIPAILWLYSRTSDSRRSERQTQCSTLLYDGHRLRPFLPVVLIPLEPLSEKERGRPSYKVMQ
jgi:hypothetical protein